MNNDELIALRNQVETFHSESSYQFISYSQEIKLPKYMYLNLSSVYTNYSSNLKYFFNSRGKEIIIGFDKVAEFKDNESQFDRLIIKKIKRINNTIYSVSKKEPKAYWLGGQSFNSKNQMDIIWEEWSKYQYFLPELCLRYTEDKGLRIIIILEVSKVQDLMREISKRVDKIIEILGQSFKKSQNKAKLKLLSETSKNDWLKYVKTGLGYIKEDSIKKVVFSRIKSYEVSAFKFSKILTDLEIKFQSSYIFDFMISHKNRFFGASPELLLRVNNNQFETIALAGSNSRGVDQKEDELLEQELLSSEKDLLEHSFVVDNTLKIISNFIQIADDPINPQISKYSNIQHLKTNIKGELKKNIHILELVNILHPTPALAGLPTDRAVRIITDVETHDRGWYGGPIGWFDSNGNGEFIVGIRSARLKDNKLTVYAGAGIVKGSIPIKEWEETETKFLTIEELFEK